MKYRHHELSNRKTVYYNLCVLTTEMLRHRLQQIDHVIRSPYDQVIMWSDHQKIRRPCDHVIMWLLWLRKLSWRCLGWMVRALSTGAEGPISMHPIRGRFQTHSLYSSSRSGYLARLRAGEGRGGEEMVWCPISVTPFPVQIDSPVATSPNGHWVMNNRYFSLKFRGFVTQYKLDSVILIPLATLVWIPEWFTTDPSTHLEAGYLKTRRS